MKKYRFFFHYHRREDRFTVHFRGQCIPCKNVKLQVYCESKRNETQPRAVVQGFCKQVKVSPDGVVVIE